MRSNKRVAKKWLPTKGFSQTYRYRDTQSLTLWGFASPTFEHLGAIDRSDRLEAPGSYSESRGGRSGGWDWKWAWERNLSPEMFTLTSVCRTSSALSASVSPKLHSVRFFFGGGLNGLRSACAAGSHQVNEMISSAHLKWTKSSTRWTPAPFS